MDVLGYQDSIAALITLAAVGLLAYAIHLRMGGP